MQHASSPPLVDFDLYRSGRSTRRRPTPAVLSAFSRNGSGQNDLWKKRESYGQWDQMKRSSRSSAGNMTKRVDDDDEPSWGPMMSRSTAADSGGSQRLAYSAYSNENPEEEEEEDEIDDEEDYKPVGSPEDTESVGDTESVLEMTHGYEPWSYYADRGDTSLSRRKTRPATPLDPRTGGAMTAKQRQRWISANSQDWNDATGHSETHTTRYAALHRTTEDKGPETPLHSRGLLHAAARDAEPDDADYDDADYDGNEEATYDENEENAADDDEEEADNDEAEYEEEEEDDGNNENEDEMSQNYENEGEEDAALEEGEEDEIDDTYEEVDEGQEYENDEDEGAEEDYTSINRADAYERYKTAYSSLLDHESTPAEPRRTDSINSAAMASQRDLVSRHDSKGYQSEAHSTALQKERLSREEEEGGEEEEEEEEPELNYGHTDSTESTATVKYENLKPYSLAAISQNVHVIPVAGKGRCTFAKKDFQPGDIIYIETPVLVVLPSLDEHLWGILQKLHTDKALDLPPVWHLAALYSLTELPLEQLEIILDKWIPDPNKEPSPDIIRVLQATGIPINPQDYEKVLQAWRYNSFGHHVENEGLVLYNRVSMLAHDCSASASWHYGDNDAFVLRARQYIPQGGEITISYIGDDELLKSTHIRQEKLFGWLFTCGCSRCASEKDGTRGFRCPTCGAGTTFFLTRKEPDQSLAEGKTTTTACTLCQQIPSKKTIKEYLVFEDAYIARLDETDKTDLRDVELVFSEAQRVFTQHWVLYTLNTILFEGYRDSTRWLEAAVQQDARIKYISHAVPKASYTLAWLYEELGDVYANHLCPTLHTAEAPQALDGFQQNLLAEKYETAMNILFVLCGPQHDYTTAAHIKLSRVLSNAEDEKQENAIENE